MQCREGGAFLATPPGGAINFKILKLYFLMFIGYFRIFSAFRGLKFYQRRQGLATSRCGEGLDFRFCFKSLGNIKGHVKIRWFARVVRNSLNQIILNKIGMRAI